MLRELSTEPVDCLYSCTFLSNFCQGQSSKYIPPLNIALHFPIGFGEVECGFKGRVMIIVMMAEGKIKKELEKKLTKLSLGFRVIPISSDQALFELYKEDCDIRALVTEGQNPSLPDNAWFDVLDALGRRFPVVVLSQQDKHAATGRSGRANLVTWLQNATLNDLIAALDTCGALGTGKRFLIRDAIPMYNPMLSVHMLQQNGSLSILSIHATDFRKVAIEYGSEAYHKLQLCFQQLIFQLWGAAGSFRSRDILCRCAPNSNIFYILLEQARSDAKIPPPGALEKLADRLVTKLQGQLWAELFKPKEERLLPSYLQDIPKFSVGHATAIYNPCTDSSEAIDTLLETSKDVAKVQHLRIIERQREFMQALIQTPGLLTPHYQGVFDAKKLSLKAVKEAQKSASIAPLADAIYGFESLIRVNTDQVRTIMQNEGPIYLEPRFLRPDIIFSMAGDVKLSLELDQACLRQATLHFTSLPGKLMANILPRNFYYIDQLQHLIPDGTEITFEVSESEAINNFGLLQQARETLSHKKFAIAIDDFGKGYADLDRIIKIKPDVIKLDRSLIEDIQNDMPKKAFVKGLINAARFTNSMILAEGVETIEEMRELIDMGVDLLQGFLLHVPQSVLDIKRELNIVEPQKELDTVA